MSGIDKFTLLYLVGAAFLLVFTVPKAERFPNPLPAIFNWLAVLSLLFLGLIPLQLAKVGLLVLLVMDFGLLKLGIWWLTRSPLEWELARRALLGQVGGAADAASERRLDAAPNMLFDRRLNRITFKNRLSHYGQYRMMRAGEGWRGVVAKLLL